MSTSIALFSILSIKDLSKIRCIDAWCTALPHTSWITQFPCQSPICIFRMKTACACSLKMKALQKKGCSVFLVLNVQGGNLLKQALESNKTSSTTTSHHRTASDSQHKPTHSSHKAYHTCTYRHTWTTIHRSTACMEVDNQPCGTHTCPFFLTLTSYHSCCDI